MQWSALCFICVSPRTEPFLLSGQNMSLCPIVKTSHASSPLLLSLDGNQPEYSWLDQNKHSDWTIIKFGLGKISSTLHIISDDLFHVYEAISISGKMVLIIRFDFVPFSSSLFIFRISNVNSYPSVFTSTVKTFISSCKYPQSRMYYLRDFRGPSICLWLLLSALILSFLLISRVH